MARGTDFVHCGDSQVVRPVQHFRRLPPGAGAECGRQDLAVRQQQDASGVDQHGLDASHERRIGARTIDREGRRRRWGKPDRRPGTAPQQPRHV